MPLALARAMTEDPTTALALRRGVRAEVAKLGPLRSVSWLPLIGVIVKIVLALLPLILAQSARVAAIRGLPGPPEDGRPPEILLAEAEAREGPGPD